MRKCLGGLDECARDRHLAGLREPNGTGEQYLTQKLRNDLYTKATRVRVHRGRLVPVAKSTRLLLAVNHTHIQYGLDLAWLWPGLPPPPITAAAKFTVYSGEARDT